MKALTAIALVTASMSAFSATDKREYYLCTPFVEDEIGGTYAVIAGESKDFFAFVQIGEVTHRVSKGLGDKRESRFNWWDKDDKTQSMIVKRDSRYSNKTAYVANFYDFSTLNDDGTSSADQSWQCLKR